jgi:hypothetical protein
MACRALFGIRPFPEGRRSASQVYNTILRFSLKWTLSQRASGPLISLAAGKSYVKDLAAQYNRVETLAVLEVRVEAERRVSVQGCQLDGRQQKPS